MSRQLVIFGAGGHAKVVADVCEDAGYTVVALYTDDQTTEDNGHWSIRVGRQTCVDDIKQHGFDYLVAIGDNATRQTITEEIRTATQKDPISCISPHAVVSSRAVIEPGAFIAPGVVINVDARIGQGAIINTSATIDHDCGIGAFAAIQPGAHLGGGVRVGVRSTVGIGASVRQYLTIGEDVLIGGGAMVVKDILSGATAIGVPAKVK